MSRETKSNLPPKWTVEEIEADTKAARAEFRQRRLTEPLADYNQHYPTAMAAADVVIGALRDIMSVPADRELVAGIVGNKEQFAALRSLAVVPISEDDLDTLLDASVNKTALRRNQKLADELAQLLATTLDPQRFPWVVENRAPTPAETATAKLATSVLTTVSAVQAARRNEERDALEGFVEEILIAAGYTQATKPKDGISSPAKFPEPKSFFRQCNLGGHNADFVIRLADGRLFALECKASNSAINGRKRLNKEVGMDAEDWYRKFGSAAIVVGAALRGVYNVEYVAAAQDANVYIFWWHRMEKLSEFLTK